MVTDATDPGDPGDPGEPRRAPLAKKTDAISTLRDDGVLVQFYPHTQRCVTDTYTDTETVHSPDRARPLFPKTKK